MIIKKNQTYLLASIIIAIIIFILIASKVSVLKDEIILLEAENAIEIKPPLKVIKDEKASNNMAIVSTYVLGTLESSAQYEIVLSHDGKYRIWCRCYWLGGCNNSYIIQFNESNKYLVGNDTKTLYNWHWVKGPVIQLSKGKNELRIWSNEQGARLDLIQLSTNVNYIPSQI